MLRFRITIPADWIPSAIRSLQNALGAEAKELASHVAKAEEHARYQQEGGRLLQLEWADENRRAMHRLEEALDQLGGHEEQAPQEDIVVDAEARGVRVALAGVLSGASHSVSPNYDDEILTDGRLADVALMLASVQRCTSRARSAPRRRSTSRKPSA